MIVVRIDCPVVVVDLINYLRMFDVPITLHAKEDGEH